MSRRGASIDYAEFDGIPICILPDGTWCEREAGHDGPHVQAAPIAPYTDEALYGRKLANPKEPSDV